MTEIVIVALTLLSTCSRLTLSQYGQNYAQEDNVKTLLIVIDCEIMTQSASFIDLVVLESIRKHFVSGAILAVTTKKLDVLIWANAAGARAFGNTTLVHAAGTHTILSRAQQRQIQNGIHSGNASLVRIGADLVSISAEMIDIDGQEAVLLSAPHTALP